MLNALALACVLLAPTPGGAPQAPAPVRPVHLLSLEGLPPDSASRATFESALRAEFAAEALPIEGSGTLRVRNGFRLVGPEDADSAWTLQVIVGLPQLVRPARGGQQPAGGPTQRGYASRGITVAIVSLSPEAIANGARAMPVRFGVVFPIPPAPKGTYAQIPRGGYPLPWVDVGRACARLALEVLHQQAESLPEGTRLSIAPANRAEARPGSSP